MKKLVFYFLYGSGIARFIAWINRRRVMILCYHGVTERSSRNPRDVFGLHVRQDRFERQLSYLRKKYRVLSLTEYLEKRERPQSLPSYSVVVTFDDGYRNFVTAAAPILKRVQIPACVFVITDRTTDRQAGDLNWADTDDESYLSWSEIAELRSQGFEFGSHTCSHPRLPDLSEPEMSRELSKSKAELACRLRSEALPLAYPFGLISETVISRSREAGYACGLTTDPGFNEAGTDLFKLRRTLIGDDDDIAAFATRLSRLTRWLSIASSVIGRG